MTHPDDPDDQQSRSLAHDLHVEASTRLTEAFVASEARMRQRIELLAEIVFETDANGVIIFLNRAWSAAMGGDATAMIGKVLRERVLFEDQFLFDANLETATQTTSTERIPIRLRHDDGSTVWMEMSIVLLADGGHLGALRDITRQRRYQEELTRLSLVANFTDNFVIITDAKGRIEWVNAAFTKRTGYQLKDIVGLVPGHILQGNDTDPVEVERIRENLRQQRAFSSKILNYTSTGETYWTMLHVNPILDNDGVVERFISVQSDTTELHSAQMRAEFEKLRAESANQEKSMFLANMSHELRTPITGVLGLADLLLGTELNETQRKYVEILRSSTGVLLAVLNDVLDFSKIEHGEIKLEKTPFFVRLVIQNVVDLMRPQFAAKGLTFSWSIAPDVPTRLEGDPARLQQILYNLVGNALKFTRAGEVSLSVSVREDAEPGYHHLDFKVSDTGIGIPEEAVNRLFRPFVQADSSTTRRFGGTGLGLWICQRLVHLMGGSIGVRPNEGGGSVFWFDIRALGLPEQSAPRPYESPRARIRPLNVLIADDNDINRLIVRAGLERMGHKVDEAHSGAEAIDAVAANDYDVILMDMQMPVVDGRTATVQIRQMDANRGQIPIIALTADAVLDHRGRYMASGLDDFLVKPVDWNILARILERVAEGEFSRIANG